MIDYASLLPDNKEDIQDVVRLLKYHPGLLAEIENLRATPESKHELIDRFIPESLRPLCKILSDNDDISMLPDLLGYALGKPLDPNVPTAEVLYAKAPTDDQRRGLKKFIKQQYDGAQVRIV